MRRLICASLAGLCLGGTVGVVAHSQTQQKATKPSPAIDELLWWLPTDTETVQVTQTPPRRD